jgi:hypothetical protein
MAAATTCMASAAKSTASMTGGKTATSMAAACVSTSRSYAAMNSSTVPWASGNSAAIAAVSASISVSAPVPIATAIAVAPAAIAAAPAVPRSDADEGAAHEPARPIIAVRRASVRIIRVVAPLTGRGTIFGVSVSGIGNHRGSDSHSHCNLGLCCRRERHSQKQR